MSKKAVQSIVIVVIILVLIGGVWVLKHRDELFKDKTNSSVSEIKDKVDESPFALEITGDSVQLDKLKGYNIPILLDFSGTDCPACVILRPTLEELNKELEGKAFVKIADIWANTALADGFPVRAVPTMFFFDGNGKPYVPPEDNPDGLIMYKDKQTGEHIYTVKEGIMEKERILAIFEDMGLLIDD
ncbi:MAG: thioredoxin family protein [Clostridiales bacterium]|nr:thioredoxin family protein [Clostridiales bacterium]